MNTVTIPAQDTTTDWFGGYIAAVEAATGAEWQHDDTAYGIFADASGAKWEAYVEPSRSNRATWVVIFTNI